MGSHVLKIFLGPFGDSSRAVHIADALDFFFCGLTGGEVILRSPSVCFLKMNMLAGLASGPVVGGISMSDPVRKFCDSVVGDDGADISSKSGSIVYLLAYNDDDNNEFSVILALGINSMELD
jgi:hypothetical protein